jgi:hypothetical protein
MALMRKLLNIRRFQGSEQGGKILNIFVHLIWHNLVFSSSNFYLFSSIKMKTNIKNLSKPSKNSLNSTATDLEQAK